MLTVGFIGLGHMGAPMATQLLKAGFELTVFDQVPEALAALKQEGAKIATNLTDVAKQSVVITMLPHDAAVLSVYETLCREAKSPTILVDCSTVSIATTLAIHKQASQAGIALLDAPVSGGTKAAANGALTFMVGGDATILEKVQPLLNAMGKQTYLAGEASHGQAAKICNNMLLGISMLGVSEMFHLANRLGLDAKKVFDITSHASGRCWSLTDYCPWPDVLPDVPSSRDYQPGFTAQMMLKDLTLAEQAAGQKGAACVLGSSAAALYRLFCQQGHGALDFSAVQAWLESSLPQETCK